MDVQRVCFAYFIDLSPDYNRLLGARRNSGPCQRGVSCFCGVFAVADIVAHIYRVEAERQKSQDDSDGRAAGEEGEGAGERKGLTSKSRTMLRFFIKKEVIYNVRT